jgi:hypothetical protein
MGSLHGARRRRSPSPRGPAIPPTQLQWAGDVTPSACTVGAPTIPPTQLQLPGDLTPPACNTDAPAIDLPV